MKAHRHRSREKARGEHKASDKPAVLCGAAEEPSPALDGGDSHEQLQDPETKPSPAPDSDNPGDKAQDSNAALFPGLSQILQPLSTCLREHSACGKPGGPHIAITLIDCETRELMNSTSSVSYVALSYVWGTNTQPKPLALGDGGNKCFLAAEVSRVIEDAIVVTRDHLGIRYIWVDQYCINQGDPAVKARQIDDMKEVYMHAEVTIVAAVGADADAGLAAPCTAEEAVAAWYESEVPDSGSDTTSRHHHKTHLPVALDTIVNSVWNTRGWTYQESYISRRVLVFHTKGTYFECSEGAREMLDQDTSSWVRAKGAGDFDRSWTSNWLPNGPNTRFLATADWSNLLSWLAYLVSAYSARSLKMPDDVLRAFGAVLKDVNGVEWEVFQDTASQRSDDLGMCFDKWNIAIVQGVPFHYDIDDEERLPGDIQNATLNAGGLCWHHGPGGNARRKGFPSWSWAGWVGPVEWKLPLPLEKGVAFQVQNPGFRRTLRRLRDLDWMAWEEASASTWGEDAPQILSFESVAVPPNAFAAKEGDPEDTIRLFGYAMPWGEEDHHVHSQDGKHGCLTHLDGLRHVSRLALRKALQKGELILVLLYIHENVHGTGFQAWILQRGMDNNGNAWYERVGGVYHHMSMSYSPLRKKELRLYNRLMRLSYNNLKSFDIL
ncbi:hypothetical protein N8I77_006648 [Diaporthe amygdali]|uniref:Heterokaryon incompatibility domain-containing protein n=1 Tax=Phomopsis amygdali TaxID=1214568 RepID=A0AAD9SIF6_PHOAM|nr:hypothetical protein N8I77_006648 [Diaporthe amygdali]